MGCGGSCVSKTAINPEPKQVLNSVSLTTHTAQSRVSVGNLRPNPTEKTITENESREVHRKLSYLKKKSPDEGTNYNVLCWCDDADTLQRIRSNPYAIKILPSGVRVHLTYVTEHGRPTICDCALYFITHLNQLNEARKFRARYRHIWSHFVVCSLPEVKIVEEELNAEHLVEEVLSVKLMASTDKMMELLKRVFNSIDTDHNGSVDIEELKRATLSLCSDFSKEEIDEAINTIDTNKNGIIEYSEFVEWWRSGRQGAYKLSVFIDRMTASLALQVPETLKILKSMRSSKLLTKEMSTKQLHIGVGKISEAPALTWKLELGTAARREQLLYSALEVFNWLSKEHCLIFSFKTTEDLDEGHLMNLLTSTVELVVGSLRERALIRDKIDYHVIMQDTTLHFGITLDMNLALFKPLLSQLTPWQQLLEAPVDQLLSLVFRSGSLQEMSNSFVSIKVDHWSKAPRYLLQSIWKFLGHIGLENLEPVLSQSKDANFSMTFESTDELQKSWIVEQVQLLNQYVELFSSEFTTVKNLYKELTLHAAPDFDVYLRFENLGIHSSFTSANWPLNWQILSLN